MTTDNTQTMRRIVVLTSRETAENLPAVLAGQATEYNGQVVCVVASSEFATSLDLVERSDVPSRVFSYDDFRREGKPHALYEQKLAHLLQSYSPDLILIDGWNLSLSRQFLRYFPWRVLRVAQGLLGEDGKPFRCADGTNGDPLFGLSGANAVQAALASGHAYTGSTVYVVVDESESGPVVDRGLVRIMPGDTVDSLHTKLRRQEAETVLGALHELCIEMTSVRE